MKKMLFLVFCFFCFSSSCLAYYSAAVDVTTMNVVEIQEAIDAGYLTYEGLIRIYLDRINTYDKDFNAIITINENAIDEAKKCDDIYRKNGRSSLLFGIPIIVKDNIDVVGMPTTVGTKILSDSFPKKDAKVIENLKNQGAIILAKSNMSEFAFMASSSTSSYGTVRNAYNHSYSSYGSSGGSAVSVALNYAPLAIGTDTNASLRAPASANGVIGLRPTYGKTSVDGVVGYDITRDVVGPIARNTIDSFILYQGMLGEKIDLDKLDFDKGIKIGVVDQFLYGDSSIGIDSSNENIVDLTEKVLKKLEDNGAEIVHLKDFYKYSYNSIKNKTLGGWTMCYSFDNYIKGTESKIKNFRKLSTSNGHIYSLYSYARDCKRDIAEIELYEDVKKPFNDDIVHLFLKNDLDVVVYPTNRNLLLKVGGDDIKSNSIMVASTLGYPAASVLLGYIDGLPYGLEFMALKDDDYKLYEMMSFYDSVNSSYELPDIAPSLYEIPIEVQNLKKYYDENRSGMVISIFSNNRVKNYKKIVNEINEFFLNYNEESDYSDKASRLYHEYAIALDQVKDHNTLFIGGVAAIFLGFLIFYNYIRFKKRKNKRRRKSLQRKK